MPIYEYRCNGCGHELESIQKISDSPLIDCPECQKPELKKLLSAPGFRLKGGGWYETDFKKEGRKNLHDSGKQESKPSKAENKKESGSKPAKSTPEKKPSAKS